MTTQQLLTPHQSQYFAWLLTRRAAGDSVESLASTLVDSQVDLNPHQVDAALFACRNPLSRGVILADEVGLGKTIEAGLVISQRWAERRRKMLIIVPANLRKQWHQELQDKFGLQGLILEAKNYNAIRKQERQNPFLFASGPIICSYQFAKAKADDVKGIDWDLVVLDEAHRLRNVYKTSNVIAKTLKEALSRVHSKVLLTATPLQNSLLELYGLVSFIDDRVFGDLDSFRSQFTGREQSFTRAALVEHFKERGKVMIATEAGAEGINLQFCSLVINYDLPWNPQRIEQRIGRCHRYGQKFDVVVVNFVDLSNEADKRVYELLSQKFQLFEGVFGASDEVLGAIGSGVDFERRIAEIYQNCREPEEIKSSFEQLQLDLSGEINEAMVKTRQVLLENFDEEVQEKLRMRADDSRNARNRFERMLMDLTRAELVHCAAFDDDGFDLRHIPTGIEHSGLAGIELGRYELPRRSGDAHLYRINHPLARWGIEQAKARALDGARLAFDYNAYGSKISTLEAYRGKAGWLTVKLISVETLGNQEQHLLVAAGTTDGVVLAEEDPEKLLRLIGTFAGLRARPPSMQG